MDILDQIKNKLRQLSVKNGYAIGILVFLVWMTFFDKHNFIDQYKVSKTLNSIESEIAEYEDKYKQALEDKKNLENDKEKFAREQYNYSEQGEEIFIIK